MATFFYSELVDKSLDILHKAQEQLNEDEYADAYYDIHLFKAHFLVRRGLDEEAKEVMKSSVITGHTGKKEGHLKEEVCCCRCSLLHLNYA